MTKYPITPRGHADLEAEIKRLKSVDRLRITQAISEARAHGDLSENAEYHAAREQHSRNESRISMLSSQLAGAEVIDISRLSGDSVMFGATVSLENADTSEKRTVQIVGEYEADMSSGRISVQSPIARALIGRKAGDFVEVNTPKGAAEYEILSVNYSGTDTA